MKDKKIVTTRNVGKVFEEDFKNSVPEYVICTRLRDAPQVFKKTARYSHENPCDFLLFDSKRGIFSAFELKTTKNKFMTFDSLFEGENTKTSNTIHKHQIIGLSKYKKYNRVNSGFIFCFRNPNNAYQDAYYLDVVDFIKMVSKLNKKSFNLNDLEQCPYIKLNGKKKRTRYEWDIEELLNELYRRNTDGQNSYYKGKINV